MSIEALDIQRAVMDGNVGIVKKLLADLPKLAMTKDPDGRTPLHWAASFQNLELVKALLNPSQYAKDSENKITVDIDDFLDDSLWTPFHISASTGSIDIFKAMATHNPVPDPNLQTSTGQTCLHYAVSKNSYEIVDYLLEEMKASTRIKDKKGQLPLHRAAAIGSETMVQMLVQTGKSPLNTTDSFGLSPLHHALAEGHADVALQLVKYGADWRQLTAEGDSPMDVALNDKIRIFFKKGLVEEGLLEE